MVSQHSSSCYQETDEILQDEKHSTSSVDGNDSVDVKPLKNGEDTVDREWACIEIFCKFKGL